MRWLRLLGRGTTLFVIVLVHFVYWLLGWLGQLLTFRPRDRRKDWFGKRLTGLLRTLGATYVKVGQIMSTRPDLFPSHVTRNLETLQDDVGAFDVRHVREKFVLDFGKEPQAIFSSFDERPIASASVAQVHRAILQDGREVAVKVRRPRIEHLVQFDLAILRAFAWFLELLPVVRLYAPRASVDEFARAIEMQIDLRIEAENNRRFQRYFDGHQDIEFPELVPELCSSSILTMSFVTGVKVLQFQHIQADPTRLAKIGFHTLLKMVFEDGFVHADLHPGNILVTAEHRVAILDLGLTAELSEQHRRIFAEFFGAWASGDGKTMARLMSENSPSAHVRNYPAYETEMCAFVERYYGKQLGEVAISTVVFDMMGIMRRHKVRVNAVFTMVNIAIAVTEGIGRQLDDKLDLMSEALPFFLRLRAAGKL